MNFSISPLSLDPLTRDTWGSFDAMAIRQLALLADDACDRPKLYKSPDAASELVPAYGYVSHGLKITPGSLLYGFYLPAAVVSATVVTPPQFNVQITDTSLDLKLFDEAIPSLFLANFKPSYLSANFQIAGSFPNLLVSPYPVVGSGLFLVEIWETSGSQQRIELVFGSLEPVEET